MPKKELDHQTIKGMKPPSKPVDYFDTVETGLILRLSKAGGKTFAYRYRFAGKNKRFNIGKFPGVSLSDARKRVQKLRVLVNEGIDPQAEKNKRRNRPDPQIFKELATEFKDKYLPPLRETTRIEYKRIIDVELIPAFGKYPIKEITRSQIISFLDKKAIKEGSPTMANRIRARLSTMYTFAIERGLAEANPVSAISLRRETRRERYYNEDEIRELWTFFEKQQQPTQSVFKMLLVCGQRKGETSRMKWEDITGDVWTIPAEDAKGKRTHDVPMPAMALEVIEKLKPWTGESIYVFESPKKDNQPIEKMDWSIKNIKDESNVPDFRLHDLRRTVATYMAKLGVDRTVLGKLLNHKGLAGDGQVTAIYDRHSYMDEKRKALNLWNQYLRDILVGKTEKKIYRIG